MGPFELSELMAVRTGHPHPLTREAVLHMSNRIMRTLEEGGRIELRGFGSLEMRDYSGYQGRNPRNQRPVEVRPKQKPVFRASPALLARFQEVK
jgi:integration host factor subunit beta